VIDSIDNDFGLEVLTTLSNQVTWPSDEEPESLKILQRACQSCMKPVDGHVILCLNLNMDCYVDCSTVEHDSLKSMLDIEKRTWQKFSIEIEFQS